MKKSKNKRTTKKYSKKSITRSRSRKSEMSRAIKAARAKRSGALHRHQNAHIGIFSTTQRGYGFVTCHDFDDDVFIPASKTLGAAGGDEVRFIVRSRSATGRIDGEICEIIKRNDAPVLGRIYERELYVRRGGKRVPVRSFEFVPDSSKQISFPVRVSSAAAAGAKHGDRVALKILEYPTRTSEAVGRVERIFGAADSIESAVEAILYDSGVMREFSREVLAEAQSLKGFADGDYPGRLDLRGKTVFTIDSEYAKDLDDAISVEKTDNGWVLGVHIADVAHYVKAGGAIDVEARNRGNSVYYPGSVIPMLPEVLSNGHCSLNMDSEKLTLSAIIELDSKGEILSSEVRESVISSAARGVYSELNAILDKSADSALKKKYPKAVLDMLKEAVRLYKVLFKRAEKRGCFELESGEAVIKLDDKGYPCDIVRVDRGVCERLIEQFMLCANEAVARLVCSRGLHGVYRIHEKPDSEKCAVLLQYAENLGIEVKKMNLRADKLAPADMQKLLKSAAEKNVGRALSPVLLRSLMKARYEPIPLGHYGLALEFYSHFTSPIRRYSDLILHRYLKKALAEGDKLYYNAQTDIPDKDACPVNADLSNACEAANEGEVRALTAERSIDDVYKAYFMKNRIGDEFDAVIVSVTSFGFFAELDNTCEGLVLVSTLGGLGYYDESHMKLTDAYGRSYKVGENIRVCLEDVDIATGKMTFSLVENEAAGD